MSSIEDSSDIFHFFGKNLSLISRLHFEQNPMLNPAILTTFFDVCDTESLASFRLVCKLWYNGSLDAWRGSVCLPLIEKNEPGWKYLSAAEFHDLVEDSQSESECGQCKLYKFTEKPYSNFRLSNSHITLRGDILNFWNTYGSWMKRIFLRNCEFQKLQALMTILLTKTPNLEVLQMSIKSSHDNRPLKMNENSQVIQKNLKLLRLHFGNEIPGREFPFLWIDFLQRFPGLRCISFHNYGTSYDDLGKFLGAVSTLRKLDGKMLALNNIGALNIMVSGQPLDILPPSIIQHFEDAQLPLQTLKLDCGMKTEEDVIQKIIEIHQNILQILHLFRGTISNPWPMFPFGLCLESLQDLELHGHVISNFSFLKGTPNLRKLHIFRNVHHVGKRPSSSERYSDYEEYKAFMSNKRLIQNPCEKDMVTQAENICDMEKVRIQSLEELHGDFDIENPASLIKLTRWLPRVHKLRIRLTKQTFPVVCEFWRTSLSKLELLAGSDVDDAAITGIVDLDTDTVDKDISTARHSKRCPNVTYFRNLESFHYCEFAWKRQHPLDILLTEQSVEEGFLHLPYLKSLQIYVVKSLNHMTMIKLNTKIPYVIVHTRADAEREFIFGNSPKFATN